MSARVQTEIEAYRAIAARVSGRVVHECGLALYCAPGVMPPANRVTRCLAAAIRAERADRVLDLGCGTGILALCAARTAVEVVGTDIDPRAVDCSQVNAHLNAIQNVRFLLGDAYAPLAGATFDLIVSNPPFYPADRLTQAPGPVCVQADDPLLDALIRGLRGHLAPGGRACFVTSSLSDNAHVRDLLDHAELTYQCRRLEPRNKGSQDILLWTAHRSGG